jgi:hypothetical protein
MKSLLVATVLFFAAPAAAFGGASLTMREVPLHGGRKLSAAAPQFEHGAVPHALARRTLERLATR